MLVATVATGRVAEPPGPGTFSEPPFGSEARLIPGPAALKEADFTATLVFTILGPAGTCNEACLDTLLAPPMFASKDTGTETCLEIPLVGTLLAPESTLHAVARMLVFGASLGMGTA
jgi:hypothetical protein